MKPCPAFIILLMLPLAAMAKEVVVGFGKDKPPFVFAREERGLEIDIFREALAASGHTLAVEHFDNGALVHAVLRGRVAAVATAQSDSSQLCRVEQFIRFDNVAVSLASRDLSIHQVNDLANYSVVAWEKAYNDLGYGFYQLFAPQSRRPERLYLEHHSQEAQVKMLWLNRADVLVIDRVIFEWYRLQLPASFQSQRQVTYHPVFDTPTWYPALFRDRALCDQFRQGLEQLKASGRYADLYQKYIN